MINQLIRYQPALRWIRTGRFERICEIGSGQNGICKFLDRRVVGVDRDFSDYREDGQVRIHPNLTPICADLLEGTDFADHEFDLVLCVDMLEHIPREDRMRAVREILRIGRNAFLAVPEGSQAQACDRWLAQFLERRGRKPPGWLYEHLQHDFPEAGEVGRLLAAIPGVRFQRLPNDHVRFHKVVVLLEILRFARLSERASRWRFLQPLLRLFQAEPAYRSVYLVTSPPPAVSTGAGAPCDLRDPSGNPAVPPTPPTAGEA